MRAIALVSGGLDSLVAAWAAREQSVITTVMTFDYGQRARLRELEAGERLARRLDSRFIPLRLPWLGQLGHSALTDQTAPVPMVQTTCLDDPEHTRPDARAVWVPNRNGVFVNVAAAYAEALDCDAIVCGFNAEEAATFPDNSLAFMEAADRFLALSTLRHPRILSPTARLRKQEIVVLGQQLGAPLEWVWSCYHGGERHCWQCESCQRLKRALIGAGAWEQWLERGGDRARHQRPTCDT